MFSCVLNVFFSVITFIIISQICVSEIPPPETSLYLYSPGEVEYTEVIVRRLHDNLTLVCELRGDTSKRDYVWNFMPGNGSGGSPQPLLPAPDAPHRSRLVKLNLTADDGGRYMCSSPPFSQTKFVLVQTATAKQCARGAFSCGQRCVLPAYVCDGRPDCLHREDEAPELCHSPCSGPDKLNCSSGRCVPAAACCARAPAALCAQPACCDEHPRFSRLHATFDDFPLPPEDRHAPDDYGFIQSTIYTVTACALIFMIAVVLLVSAVCKMHMKRAALRACAARPCAQTHRYPPCYEASRLLDPDGRIPSQSPHDSPTRLAMQCAVEAPNSPEAGFGLGRLSEIFSSRYRQVPTQCLEVEMQAVRPASLGGSPARAPRCADAEFYFSSADATQCGRDLNSMATPVEFFRRRALRRNTLERVMDQIGERQRPFTLQLGRFQLSIPKFGRRSSNDRRPDTPNVAEIDIEDLDFVRLNSNDTYTLNGRTIRLLGANFENYPVLPDGSVRPPPYTEAMRYKLYGPPPEYLSRDGLNGNNADEEARNNVEMPPNYDELGENNGNVASTSGINNVPSIPVVVPSMSTDTVSDYAMGASVPVSAVSPNTCSGNNNGPSAVFNNNGNTCSDTPVPSTSNVNNNVESIKAVIDNLPAIDSDVNANEAEA